MNRSKVIVAYFALAILVLTSGTGSAAVSLTDKKVDSLFAIASSGSVKFKDMVQPAIDSTAAMGAAAVPRLLEKLNTKSPRERVTLQQMLKKIGAPAIPGLLASLNLGDGLSVERAAYSLGDIGDSSALGGLLAASRHTRWQVREQVIGSLGRLHSHRADSTVMAALSDTIPLVRKSAAVACGQLKTEASIPQLVHLLGDTFYGARMPASLALLNLDTTVVIRTIADSVNSENVILGNLGCWVLGQMHRQDATDLLVAQTKSGNPQRRAHAACALVDADPRGTTLYAEYYRKTETDSLALMKFESALNAVRDAQSTAR
jgi:HEAT repeat protein